MKECKREQINQSLPWIVELNEIACRLKIDLDKAKAMTKDSWKKEIKKKIEEATKMLLQTEIKELKGYRKNITDDMVPGKKKRYVKLTQKKAKIWFRMRADIIDPAPRQPHNPVSIWNCKLCSTPEQSTEHYVKTCPGIKEEVFDGIDRGHVYSIIQSLECTEEVFYQITQILIRIYHLVVS